MKEEHFTNREIIKMFQDHNEDLKSHIAGLIEPLTEQVKYTNGKLKRMTLVLTIIGTATATLIFTNGSELTEFILKII